MDLVKNGINISLDQEKQAQLKVGQLLEKLMTVKQADLDKINSLNGLDSRRKKKFDSAMEEETPTKPAVNKMKLGGNSKKTFRFVDVEIDDENQIEHEVHNLE
jgi:hypothetical protein